ncbi:MAG: hypothetical protein ACUVS2_16695 [Candidatus Flexifilum sp.]|jgi:hypothetical protein
MTWKRLLRIGLLTGVLFLLLDYGFALIAPLEPPGRIGVYGWIVPYRLRLPYGAENSPYNTYLTHIPAMFASHVISRPRADDEFRVVVLGDSGTWGWWLPVEDLLTEAMNRLDARIDGRRVVAYNLAYPNMTLTKDLVILDEALRYQPDLVIWNVTLNSFAPSEQMDSGLVFDNPARVRRLIACCGLALDPADPAFRPDDLLARTLVGRRRDLSAWIRYQISGFAWAATGRDLIIPETISRVTDDYAADLSWKGYDQPVTLTPELLAFDALEAGRRLTEAAGVPLWISNAPTYRGGGANSDLRYNLWYPRWAYDQYRILLADYTGAHGIPYLDLWDAIDPARFTDSPAHLDAEGNRQWAARLIEWLNQAYARPVP